MKRGDYDYNHATSGSQFLAIIMILVAIAICGVVAGLAILTSVL
jgi:hypothetical protein